eukprot:gnl/TRDRNA2_/TRDRNA2_36973_c0_seq1.p2 gnl/TRDRNA2_/TRDRNA2_36973_c0~~gnl/TRDRNA2_/TRDRNA2_36973_c0_seq1.p2  ORF type:complete len:194 (+),score=39.46 gnl/TRDRNA2_/TRDRNA2_36973_c0_seq1:111-692(+)
MSELLFAMLMAMAVATATAEELQVVAVAVGANGVEVPSLTEQWVAEGTFSTGDEKSSFVGCLQDCGTSSSGVTLDKVCADRSYEGSGYKFITPARCKALCADRLYQYMSLSCPTGDSFQCTCCNELKRPNGSLPIISAQECAGGSLTSGISENKQGTCTGFTGADRGGYVLHRHLLGGSCRAAVYQVSNLESQ